MTRFGEILPLCQTVKSIWPFSKGSFRIWPNCEMILANLYGIRQSFIDVNGQKLSK